MHKQDLALNKPTRVDMLYNAANLIIHTQLYGAIEYTDCISAER